MNLARGLGLALVLALSSAPLTAGTAAAAATRTPFVGTSTFLSESGGIPSFPDGRFHIRDFEQVYNDVVSDPRVSGTDTIVVNFNFGVVSPPVFFTGPMWGTFRVENSSGTWDGTWTGVRDENGFAFVDGVGHGSGGYDGLHAWWRFERLSANPYAPWSIEGVILDPGTA